MLCTRLFISSHVQCAGASKFTEIKITKGWMQHCDVAMATANVCSLLFIYFCSCLVENYSNSHMTFSIYRHCLRDCMFLYTISRIRDFISLCIWFNNCVRQKILVHLKEIYWMKYNCSNVFIYTTMNGNQCQI